MKARTLDEIIAIEENGKNLASMVREFILFVTSSDCLHNIEMRWHNSYDGCTRWHSLYEEGEMGGVGKYGYYPFDADYRRKK